MLAAVGGPERVVNNRTVNGSPETRVDEARAPREDLRDIIDFGDIGDGLAVWRERGAHPGKPASVASGVNLHEAQIRGGGRKRLGRARTWAAATARERSRRQR